MSTSPTTDGGLQKRAQPPGLGLRILVVDASPYLGDVLVSALEHEGCSAAVARNAAQALHLSWTLSPDLITVDLGRAFDDHFVARLPSIPLILIAPSFRNVSPGLTERAARVFEKPFYLSEVVAATLETLGRAAHP